MTIIDGQPAADFLADPTNLMLISFPRTGSHWLRFVMELYFQRPTLRRIFVYRKSRDYLLYHHHDDNLSLARRNVIYLWREPVATLYSWMRYNGVSMDDAEWVNIEAIRYTRHLRKWLQDEHFTERKLILRYRDMKQDMGGTFQRLCEYLDYPFDEARLLRVAPAATKERIGKITDSQDKIVRLEPEYKECRTIFKQRYNDCILDVMLGEWPELRAWL